MLLLMSQLKKIFLK